MSTIESEWILRSRPDGSTIGSYIDNILVSYTEFRPQATNPDGPNTIWLNSTDSMLYYGSSKIGDMLGPASSVDNHVVAFDGITGKVIKDSNVEMVEFAESGNHAGAYTRITDTSGDYPNGLILSYFDGFAANVAVGGAMPVAQLQEQVIAGQYNSANTFIGNSAGGQNINNATPVTVPTTGNVAVGAKSLYAASGCQFNTAAGAEALYGLINGTGNIAVGRQAGYNYAGAESNNICIGNAGVAAESSVIRIGATQTSNYQAGIYGAAMTATSELLSADSAGKIASTRVVISSADGIVVGKPLVATTFSATGFPATYNWLTVNTSTESIYVGTTTSAAGVASANSADNVVVGSHAGAAINGAAPCTQNTLMGANSGFSLTSGTDNTAVGARSLRLNTGGIQSTAVGVNSLGSILTGTANIGIGYNAGSSYIGAESNNICIGNAGVAAESNVIRIGTTQTSAYMAGVYGATMTATSELLSADSAGKLASTSVVISSADGVVVGYPLVSTTFDVPGIPATYNWLTVNTSTESIYVGTTTSTAGVASANSQSNVVVGSHAGEAINGAVPCDQNVLIGAFAGSSLNAGTNITAIGDGSLAALVSGSYNVGAGAAALANLASGSNNIAAGYDATAVAAAGDSYTGAESNNILMANSGVLGESNVIRVGNATHTANYQSGIYGTTMSATSVIEAVGSDGKLADSSIIIQKYEETLGYPTIATSFSVPAASTYNFLTINSERANTALGTYTSQALLHGNALVSSNTLIGATSAGALTGLVATNYNTLVGAASMQSLQSGLGNSVFGYGSFSNTTGNYNTAAGYNTLRQLATGSTNTALGAIDATDGAGSAYTGAESNNVVIANTGTLGDNNTIRIGNGTHTRAFHAGVYGVTPALATQLMVVDSAGQLGSSASIPSTTFSSTMTATNGFGPVSISGVRVGDIIVLTISAITQLLGVSVVTLSFVGAIPVGFRPAVQYMTPMIFVSNGAYDTGLVGSITAAQTGLIEMIRDLDAAPATFDNTAGWSYNIVLTYSAV